MGTLPTGNINAGQANVLQAVSANQPAEMTEGAVEKFLKSTQGKNILDRLFQEDVVEISGKEASQPGKQAVQNGAKNLADDGVKGAGAFLRSTKVWGGVAAGALAVLGLLGLSKFVSGSEDTGHSRRLYQ